MNIEAHANQWYRDAIKYEKTRAGSLDPDFTHKIDFIDIQTAPAHHIGFCVDDFRSYRSTYA